MIGKLIEALGITQRDLIKSIIAEYFFADFGTVFAVYGSPPTTIDVQHSIQPKLFGRQLPTTVTKGVELLFPGGGQELSIEWDVNVGDPVLLIGLRDFVKTASPSPAPTDIPLHYTQETMKAIPLGPYSGSAAFTIKVTGGVLQIAGSAYSMALWDQLNTALQGFVTAVNVALAARQLGTSASAITLDISGAKSSKVKAGG